MANRLEREAGINEGEQRLEKIKAQEERGRERFNSYRTRAVAGLTIFAIIAATDFYLIVRSKAEDDLTSVMVIFLLAQIPAVYTAINAFKGGKARKELSAITLRRTALEDSLMAKRKDLLEHQ